jgi:hypothetical protein
MPGITREALVVTEDQVHIGIARHDPGAHQGTPVHRVFGPQHRVGGIRIPMYLRRERIIRHTAVPPLPRQHDADANRAEQGVERDGHTSLLCDADTCHRV